MFQFLNQIKTQFSAIELKFCPDHLRKLTLFWILLCIIPHRFNDVTLYPIPLLLTIYFYLATCIEQVSIAVVCLFLVLFFTHLSCFCLLFSTCLLVFVCVCIVVNSLTHVLSLTSACHALSMSKTSKFVTLLIVTKTRKLFYFTIYKFNNNYYYTL